MKTLFVLPLILISFSLVFSQDDDKIAESYVSTSFTAAIFPESYEISEFEKRFTPTKNEVAEAEKALSRDLMSLNKEKKYQKDIIIHRRLMRFKRQYFGVINDDGERELIINAYFYERNKDPYKEEFLNERILARDSSAKYWQVSYNLDKKLLKDLKVGEVKETASKTELQKAVLKENAIELKSKPVRRQNIKRIQIEEKEPDTLNIE